MQYTTQASKGDKRVMLKFYINQRMPQERAVAKGEGGASAKETQEFIVPFWLLSPCADPATANCIIEFEHVDVVGTTVEIPICKNTKQLTPGDRLYVHQPHGVTSRFPVAYLRSAPSAKRQKKAT